MSAFYSKIRFAFISSLIQLVDFHISKSSMRILSRSREIHENSQSFMRYKKNNKSFQLLSSERGQPEEANFKMEIADFEILWLDYVEI